MKKRTMAIILSAVSALTCLSPLSAGALGEISSESLESAVSEYYGSECREWKIYALDEFDGTNTRVFQSADNLRGNLAAIYEGTSIYVSCDTPSKVIEYIEKNYPDYKTDSEYTDNAEGFELKFNCKNYDPTGMDIRNICNGLKEKGLIDSFDYKIGGYNIKDLYLEPYLTGYEAYSEKGKADKLVKTLTEFVNKHNLDFSVVVFNTEKKIIKEYPNLDILPFEFTAYADSEGKYPCYFEFPVVCLMPNEGVSDYEHSEVVKLVKEELGLDVTMGIDQSLGGGYVPSQEEQHIDVFNAILGDANNDRNVSISDAVKILQNLANSERYPLSAQGEFNADIYNTGDGITGLDANEIQKLDAAGKLN